MFENGDGGLVRRTGPRGLDPLACVHLRLLGGTLADLHALVADIDARVVHHREHRHEPAVLRADQFADAFAFVAIGHHAGGRGVDAELVFDADTANIVALAERTVGFDMVFGHDEQRDAPASFRRIGHAGEDQVNDILRQLVLTPGDVDFLALDAVLARMFAVLDRVGGGAQRADIGACLRFGEVHRPRPFAADQLGQVLFLQLLRPVVFERFHRADAEHGQQVERHVGRAEILEHVTRQREGQALAAELDGAGDRIPALLDVMFVSFGKAIRQVDRAIFEPGAFEVAHPVERGPFAGSEFANAAYDRLDHIGLGGSKSFGLRQLFDPGVYADGEQLVLGGGGIGHFGSSWLWLACRYSAHA